MADPYQILGVAKTAGADEIKSAYRKLAKKLHPDVNPGRKDIEQKFKEVTAAYDLLSDPAKRARFDRGEIDNQGNERGFAGAGAGGDPFSSFRQRRGGHPGADPFSSGGFGGINPEDIFAEFMGGAGRNARQQPQREDTPYTLNVPFIEACIGGKRRVTLMNGKTIDVTIPPGTAEGHKLRLRGQGQPSMNGLAGDALVEIHIEPHAFFTRKEQDILLDAPISLQEAILGASITVPTLDGQVSVKVPKGTNTDATLRLKGKGVPNSKGGAGDMFVKLKVVLPEKIPGDLTDFIEKWGKKNDYNPRGKFG